jgi:ABC-type transport system involved in multi-copper enzyme maturation permease subunit
MSLPAVVFAVRWLALDTFRQARSAGLTAAALLVTAVCTAFCLSVAVHGDAPPIPTQPWEDRSLLPRSEAGKHRPADLEGIEVPAGEMTFLFGAFRVPLARNRTDQVRYVEALLAGGVADTAGVLLALIWTAGFLPTFLDPAAATVLLAKPFPRWAVLAGKIAGVLAFVGGQAVVFVAAVWCALGVRTGVWDGHVFAVVPLLLVHFFSFYAVSALLAVITRSTVASVLGTAAIWFGCWWVNFTRHAAVAGGGPAAWPLDVGYWLLPKPADLGLLLLNALEAQASFAPAAAVRRGAASPELVLATSLLIPVIAIAVAARRFSRTEV